jgi:hypothetical protein
MIEESDMLKILKINPLDGKGPIEVVIDNSNFGADRLERFMAQVDKDFDDLEAARGEIERLRTDNAQLQYALKQSEGYMSGVQAAAGGLTQTAIER